MNRLDLLEPWLQPHTAAPAKRAAALASAAGLYTALFLSALHFSFGAGLTSLAIVLAVAAGWLFGPLAGAAAGPLAAGLNLLLLRLAAVGPAAALYPQRIAGEALAMLLAGLLVGWLRQARAAQQRRYAAQRNAFLGLEQAKMALERSEETLRRVTDNMLDMVVEIDPALRVRYASPSCLDIFGLPPADLTGQPLLSLVYPEDYALAVLTVQSILYSGEPVRVELRARTAQRTTIWVEVAGSVALDPEGQPEAAVLAVRDITQRRKAEDALRESEARYKPLFENHHTVMLLIDPETTQIVDANPAACAFYGYTRETLAAMHIGQINSLPERPLRQALGNAARQDDSHFFFQHRLASGQVRDVEVFTTRVQVAGKSLLYSIIHDITSRREVEHNLFSAQDSLRNIINNNADGILITSTEGVILFLNPAAEGLWGRPAAELSGELFGVPQVTGENREVEILRANGEIIAAEIRVADTEWEGRPALLVSLRDITGRRLAEQAEREQRALAEALRDTAALLTSTLEQDEVFDRILANIGNVIPHSAANIILIDSGYAITRVARKRGGRGEAGAWPGTETGASLFDHPHLKWMAETGQPLVLPDLLEASEWPGGEPRGGGSYLGAPIFAHEELVGFLNLESEQAGFFNAQSADRLQAFIHQSAAAIENARLYAALQQQALTDEVTRAYNRRGLAELGLREFDRAVRFHRALSAVMLDIDHFKRVNDTYGHLAGDQVLRILADRCRAAVREVDILGRYGGEEFLILLVENDLESAAQVAERLRWSVEQHPFETTAGSIWITISLGVATRNERTPDLQGLIRQADLALYGAKLRGRNQTGFEEGTV
jgi:diguanylate cyclase (GGDEF)-like protein/PAS domain S-box-containing protein